jgi:3-isopropylmalate/(R)-2-methylmalate dehydratase small subunit
MEPFVRIEGAAAPFDRINVDTDMIVPKQFLKTTGRAGLGPALFHELRTRPDGSDDPDFVLNKPAFRNAAMLIAGANFGCGSSREHAVWALLDFGIRAVVAPSFAEIFHGNCLKNGLLPVVLPQAEIDTLMEDARREPGARFSIDLASQRIRRPNADTIAFEIDPFRKQCLLGGWDEVSLTLRDEERIKSFEDQRRTQMPWL